VAAYLCHAVFLPSYHFDELSPRETPGKTRNYVCRIIAKTQTYDKVVTFLIQIC
jgi:hypothetical protein